LGSQAKVIPEHGRKNATVRGIGMGERNYKRVDTVKRKKKLAKVVRRGRWNEPCIVEW
jgi:hypothetical protein